MCWLSGDPFPEDIKACLASWREHLSDYEIWLWGKMPISAPENEFSGMSVKELPFDVNSTLWTRQAFEKKKYAFAADYIRLFALHNYGGIYFDSDIFVYKSFNDLLRLPYFIGFDESKSFEPAAMGAEKGASWIATVLKHYDNRAFILGEDLCDTKTLPRIFHMHLSDLKVNIIHDKIEYNGDSTELYVFDRYFFNSRDKYGPKQYKSSYCSHCYTGSWKSQEAIRRENSWIWKTIVRPISKLSQLLECVGGKPYARVKEYLWTRRLK